MIPECVLEHAESKRLDPVERPELREEGGVAIDLVEIVGAAVFELHVRVDGVSRLHGIGRRLGFERLVADRPNKAGKRTITLVETMAFCKCAHAEVLVEARADGGLEVANGGAHCRAQK